MLGAVVTTSSMAVGGRCPYAQANVGAVLTQHRTDPRLGPRMLERLREGAAPAAILKDLEKSEPGIGWRQLAIIDAKGQAAFFNGSNIYSVVKGLVGRDCVAVGNILRSTDVVNAMVQSFEANEAEPLAERLMRAIEAGDAAGGELKQIKSAGLVVAHRESGGDLDLPELADCEQRRGFHFDADDSLGLITPGLGDGLAVWRIYRPGQSAPDIPEL